MKRSRKSGFTLTEVLVASAIILLGFTAILQGMIYAKDRSEAIRDRCIADSFAWQWLWIQFNEDWQHLQNADSIITIDNSAWLRAQLPELAKNGRPVALRYEIDDKHQGSTNHWIAKISIKQLNWTNGKGQIKSLISEEDFRNDTSPYAILRAESPRSATEDKSAIIEDK